MSKFPPSLQLLVENAIKHGIGKNKSGGDIKIQSQFVEGVFLLKVVNTGKLRPSEESTGVGIKNLQKRLFLNFQEKATLKIEEIKNHVIASIQISE